MTENESIEKIKEILLSTYRFGTKEIQAIKTVLQSLENKDKEIKELKEEYVKAREYIESLLLKGE